MPTPEENLARLIAAKKRSRLLPSDIIQGGLGVTPGVPMGQQSPEGALSNIFGRLELITDLLNAAFPVFDPERRLYLTKNANDPYQGDLNNAIDAALALDPPPSAAAPVVIEILSPGEYTGNFTLVAGLYLVSLSNAPAQAVVLSSSSGATLTLPQGNSGIQGVDVNTTSADPTDTAITVVTGGDPDEGTFIMQCDIQAPNGATALRSVPGTGALLPFVIAGVNSISSGPALDLQGAGVFAIFGFYNNDGGGTVIQITNGAFAVILNAFVGNLSGAAGWLLDVDAGAAFVLGQTRFFEASNLVRGRNGAFLGLYDLTGLNNPSGSALDLDGASFAIVGNNFVGTPQSTSAYAGWVGTTTANVLFTPTLGWGTGTTVGPDQRPPAPQAGMRWYATDRPPGTEQLVFVPGAGWFDQAGTPVP